MKIAAVTKCVRVLGDGPGGNEGVWMEWKGVGRQFEIITETLLGG